MKGIRSHTAIFAHIPAGQMTFTHHGKSSDLKEPKLVKAIPEDYKSCKFPWKNTIGGYLFLIL
ncbi:MAG: hypothetical protein B2I18_02000 [Cuniculiplasma sp. C_DKE]|nr:MAG: hypothetical protein B2I18_02000 [Cuniculiplasma sp. C_DKE]